MMKLQQEHRSREAGFTLAEILVAMSVLLVGMAGIIGLFTTGLSLERRSSLAIDTAIALRDVEPLVRDHMLARLREGADLEELAIPRSPLPGWEGLDYVAEVKALPGVETHEGYLLKITVVPRGVREDRGFTWGFLPLQLRRPFEDRVHQARQETLEKKN